LAGHVRALGRLPMLASLFGYQAAAKISRAK
jgi:hypothetical protein